MTNPIKIYNFFYREFIFLIDDIYRRIGIMILNDCIFQGYKHAFNNTKYNT